MESDLQCFLIHQRRVQEDGVRVFYQTEAEHSLTRPSDTTVPEACKCGSFNIVKWTDSPAGLGWLGRAGCCERKLRGCPILLCGQEQRCGVEGGNVLLVLSCDSKTVVREVTGKARSLM